MAHAPLRSVITTNKTVVANAMISQVAIEHVPSAKTA
jgi:hypothetical protein